MRGLCQSRAMMILRNSPASPFGRKVAIAAAVLGLSGSIRIEAADAVDPADTLRKQNPVGKIPTLLLDDGTALFDSRVILEYLDHLAGGDRILPRAPDARFAALRLQSLADGVTDAALLVIYEARFRPAEHRVQSWVDHQNGKMARGLAALEASPPAPGKTPTVGDIALACALGYQDLRFEGRWRADHPKLVAWLDRFAAGVPAFEEPRFKG
jgi:glutathione S-transferase